MKDRERYLREVMRRAKKELNASPSGSLHIKPRNRKPRYYFIDEHTQEIKYINAKNITFAQQLAQKDYNKKVLQAVEFELATIKRIEKLTARLEGNRVDDIYEGLATARQTLVIPITETDEQYVEKWEAESYPQNTMWNDERIFHTEKGELVRSKSEWIIADMLHKNGVPYKYERPLELDGFRTVYPDFTALNVAERKEIYWEHFGLMDNPEYAQKAVKKVAAYMKNGINPKENLIITYETSTSPIDSRIIQKMIDWYL